MNLSTMRFSFLSPHGCDHGARGAANYQVTVLCRSPLRLGTKGVVPCGSVLGPTKARPGAGEDWRCTDVSPGNAPAMR